MAVVTIDAPCTQDTFHVTIVPRASNMIHDFITAVFHDGGANFTGKRVQYFVPGCTLPFAFATLAGTFQGIQDTFGIIDLVDGGGAFGAIAAAAAWMIGVALKFFNSPGFLIDVGK